MYIQLSVLQEMDKVTNINKIPLDSHCQTPITFASPVPYHILVISFVPFDDSVDSLQPFNHPVILILTVH